MILVYTRLMVYYSRWKDDSEKKKRIRFCKEAVDVANFVMMIADNHQEKGDTK